MVKGHGIAPLWLRCYSPFPAGNKGFTLLIRGYSQYCRAKSTRLGADGLHLAR